MKRFATALIALLALVALVTAAGSLGDGVDQPRLGVESTTVAPAPESPSAGGVGEGPNATQSAEVVDTEATAPAESGDGDGGISSLFVVALVGGLLLAAALAVLLTDDDARAPPRKDDDDGGETTEPPTPAVDPAYDSPAENAVVGAWRRLTERVDGVDDSTTPGEAASAAVDRGFPTEAVEGITGQFEAVRYGREQANSERERRASELAGRLDAVDQHRSGANGKRGDGGDGA
ncbi:DUF4129 domain-containing protein [Halosimplex salinum]|uniref:DUF4129 domain-containing protein n=1 Tax=Halosimplex salinum TaxID=1710538 RepID=UPI000F48FC1B|nr:DUF4129 domain-containing protein [Halosimplex salinum]